jgi:hypothetical protein
VLHAGGHPAERARRESERRRARLVADALEHKRARREARRTVRRPRGESPRRRALRGRRYSWLRRWVARWRGGLLHRGSRVRFDSESDHCNGAAIGEVPPPLAPQRRTGWRGTPTPRTATTHRLERYPYPSHRNDAPVGEVPPPLEPQRRSARAHTWTKI